MQQSHSLACMKKQRAPNGNVTRNHDENRLEGKHTLMLVKLNSFFSSKMHMKLASINQSTESADGGGFLNFYKPLEYISSVLSFCSIFLDM